jgi:hypothetical protein
LDPRWTMMRLLILHLLIPVKLSGEKRRSGSAA